MSELQEYTCHKRVLARPMNSSEFSTYKGLPQRIPDEQGYLVVYADGYESWSPKKAFEDGYSLGNHEYGYLPSRAGEKFIFSRKRFTDMSYNEKCWHAELHALPEEERRSTEVFQAMFTKWFGVAPD